MKEAQANTAVINAPSRKLFRPMFRARWQNMQNIINESAFKEMIPEPYVSYYIAYIEQCIHWSRGFVPMLHRSDFFRPEWATLYVRFLRANVCPEDIGLKALIRT